MSPDTNTGFVWNHLYAPPSTGVLAIQIVLFVILAFFVWKFRHWDY